MINQPNYITFKLLLFDWYNNIYTWGGYHDNFVQQLKSKKQLHFSLHKLTPRIHWKRKKTYNLTRPGFH